ncbi:EAL domain-containing protein [Paraglaciecola sp.]|uniref:EAL domain-containing protein n=1 Tax=Paraglaciecola sp. TaxID=1920173 RepID=UPI0030F41F1A
MSRLLATRLFAYMMLSDQDTPGQCIEQWRVSALRIMTIVGYLLYSIVAIHCCLNALNTDVSFVVPLFVVFYTLAALQLFFSKSHYYLSAYALLFSIVVAAICINLLVKIPTLAMLGPVFVFSLPLVAFTLLGAKAGFLCMLLNIIPFIALLSGFQLNQYIEDHVYLEHANAYIISIIFLFFNVCAPLGVARASLAAKRLNQQVQAHNNALQKQNNFYRTLFVDTEIAKLVVSNEGIISEMNVAAEKLLQCEFNELIHPLNLSSLFAEFRFDANETLVNRTLAGRMKAFKLTRSGLFSDSYYFVTIQDVTAWALLQKTLAAQTILSKKRMLDTVTGLPNREWLENKIKQMLDEPQTELSLIICKINNAQFIEQKYGFQYLSQLVRKIAEHWQSKTHIPCHLASLNNCKLCILTELTPMDVQTQIAAFVRLLPKIILLDQQKLPVDIKIGIAFSDASENTPDKLINNALYAVTSSPLQINYHDTVSLERFIEHQEINILLNEAIAHNELSIVYQPKVKGDGRLIGLEALLRWHSPVIGTVSPVVFIPIAEKSGLVSLLTNWLVTKVCEQISDWQQAGLTMVPVAINISGNDLDQEYFHEYLVNSLVEYKIPPQLVEIELTESARSLDHAKALATTRYLANWGFCITLDDFGIGYSGLSKLLSYPIKKVKIDRQFIKGIHKDERKAKVVEAIIAMCKVSHVDILAEGVEEFEEVDRLLLLGCSNFQGFVFSKPLDTELTFHLLQKQNVFNYNSLTKAFMRP